MYFSLSPRDGLLYHFILRVLGLKVQAGQTVEGRQMAVQYIQAPGESEPQIANETYRTLSAGGEKCTPNNNFKCYIKPFEKTRA